MALGVTDAVVSDVSVSSFVEVGVYSHHSIGSLVVCTSGGKGNIMHEIGII